MISNYEYNKVKGELLELDIIENAGEGCVRLTNNFKQTCKEVSVKTNHPEALIPLAIIKKSTSIYGRVHDDDLERYREFVNVVIGIEN